MEIQISSSGLAECKVIPENRICQRVLVEVYMNVFYFRMPLLMLHRWQRWRG